MTGAPTLNILSGEVAMRMPETVGVGGATPQECNPSLATR